MDFENVFSPTTIKMGGIKEVLIFVKGSHRSDSSITSNTVTNDNIILLESKKRKLKFDNNGLVIARLEPENKSFATLTETFERNTIGKISKQTIFYVDSLGHKTSSWMPPEITDYTYDAKNRLIKSKRRDLDGNIVSDDKSRYIKYEYDNKDRIIKQINQYYYDGTFPTSIDSIIYKYSDNIMISTYHDYSDGLLIGIDTTYYNSKGKPLKNKLYQIQDSKNNYEIIYKYDSKDRLISYQSICGKDCIEECEEKASFIDTYFYNDNGLLTKIIHSYGAYSCEIRFEYKK
jgi:hypothetical protein